MNASARTNTHTLRIRKWMWERKKKNNDENTHRHTRARVHTLTQSLSHTPHEWQQQLKKGNEKTMFRFYFVCKLLWMHRWNVQQTLKMRHFVCEKRENSDFRAHIYVRVAHTHARTRTAQPKNRTYGGSTTNKDIPTITAKQQPQQHYWKEGKTRLSERNKWTTRYDIYIFIYIRTNKQTNPTQHTKSASERKSCRIKTERNKRRL